MYDTVIDDRKKPKKNMNKPIIIVLSILAFLLIAAGIFLGTYYFLIDRTSNGYEASIKDLSEKINTTNKSVSSFNKEDQSAVDPDKARKGLEEKIQVLNDSKTKLQGLVPTDKYKNEHEALINGLNNNILIYRQISAFLANVNGNDIEASGENLKKYKDDCVKYYTTASSSTLLKISLPKESLTFIDNTLKYINEVAAVQKEKEITKSQNTEFVNNIDDILSNFNGIKADLSTQVSSARGSGGNLDSIITLANRYRDDLSYLKQQLSNLSVPSEALSTYNLLKNTFEDYDLYLQSIVFAVNNEKLLGASSSPDKLKELYSSSDTKFSEVIKDYDSFLKKYTDFKDSNIQ